MSANARTVPDRVKMRWLPVVLLLALVLVLAACGEGDLTDEAQPADGTADDAADDGEDANGEDADAAEDSPVAQLSAELEGLSGEERREVLLERAAEEEGDLNFYGTMDIEDANAFAEAYSDLSDVDVSIFRANDLAMLQRVVEEERAGFADGFDVIAAPWLELDILADEGFFARLDTPASEGIRDVLRGEHWVGIYMTVYAAGWNTTILSEDDVPSSWEEVLAYDGPMGFETTSYPWLGTIVPEYFVAELGYTEEEAIDLFREAAEEAISIRGRTNLALMVASGELDLAPDLYVHRMTQMHEDDGAPLGFEPVVEPLVAGGNGVAVSARTDKPASALLFVDFMLTEAQEEIMYPELRRTPAGLNVPGGLDPDWNVIMQDNQRLVDERDKWEPLWEDILRGAQRVD